MSAVLGLLIVFVGLPAAIQLLRAVGGKSETPYRPPAWASKELKSGASRLWEDK